MVLLPQPEGPTKGIFLVAGIFKFICLRTLYSLEGYLKFTLISSIFPFSIVLMPFDSLTSVVDLSSMISNIFLADSFALPISEA